MLPVFCLAFFLFGASPAHALTTISSCSDLQDMDDDRAEDYVLSQNIDCTGHDPDGDGSGFDPIGRPSSAFTGSLDGAGYTISGLTISHSGDDDMALFDALSGATIENITFSSPNITGGRRAAVIAGSASGATVIDNITINSPTVSGTDYVGGVVGNIAIGTSVISNTVLTSVDIDGTDNYVGGILGYLGTGTVRDSAVTGSITSSGGQFHGGITGINQNGSVGQRLYFSGTVSGVDRVGGITGQTNSGATTLEDVMVRGSVTGGSYVGGIIGWQFGIVLNRGYSTAEVTGDDAGTNGGTIGSGANCSDVFLLDSVSDTSGGCHTAKSSADMQDIATYTATATVGLTSAWDFIGTENDDAAGNDYWGITATDNDGYPFLNGLVFVTFDGGAGTSGDPYEISTCEQLQLIENDLGADGDETYYELTGDIDCSDTVSWNDGEGFDPLGTLASPAYIDLGGELTTVYDITRLYINRPDEDYVGLVGYAADDTYLDRMHLIDVDITGKDYVGGLVGRHLGDTYTVTIDGEVTGEDYVGGLAGALNKGTHRRLALDVDVQGDLYVGGAVGHMSDDTVTSLFETHSVGAVYADESYAGGLVGRMYDAEGGTFMSLYRSYASGPVVGEDYVGGAIGAVDGEIPDSRIYELYSSGLVSSPGTNVGGLVGSADDAAASANSFWDTETSGQSTSALDETGKTTAEMTTVATFTDETTVGLDSAWDFTDDPNDDVASNNYWDIDALENDGYPFLNNADSDPDGAQLAPVVTSVFLLYYADPDDGSITGTKLQRLASGGDGSEVTATAGSRKTFTSWTGGSTAAARTDTSVTEDAIYIASFRNRSSGSREEVVVIDPEITGMTLNTDETVLEYTYVGYAPFVNIHTSADDENWTEVVSNYPNAGIYEFDESDNIDEVNYIRLQLTDLASILDTGVLERNIPVVSGEDDEDDSSAEEVDTTDSDDEVEEEFAFPDEAISPWDGDMEPVDAVEPGDLIRGENYTTVYLITEDYKRRPFWNEAIYATYYDSFDDVIEVTDATLGVLKLGNPMMPNPETVLVKVLSLSDVSLPVMVDFANIRRKVPSEAVASSLFGELWADYVIDLPVGVHRWYAEGDDLGEDDFVDRDRLRKRIELNIR